MIAEEATPSNSEYITTPPSSPGLGAFCTWPRCSAAAGEQEGCSHSWRFECGSESRRSHIGAKAISFESNGVFGRKLADYGCNNGDRSIRYVEARRGWPAAAAGTAGPRRLPARPASGGCRHGRPAAAAGTADPRRLLARNARGGCSKMDPKMPEQ
jgi:hypothetical protein